MREIIVNLLLVLVWAALSAGLVWGIHRASEHGAIGGGEAFGLWMIGQLIILSPGIRILWRDRAVGRRSL